MQTLGHLCLNSPICETFPKFVLRTDSKPGKQLYAKTTAENKFELRKLTSLSTATQLASYVIRRKPHGLKAHGSGGVHHLMADGNRVPHQGLMEPVVQKVPLDLNKTNFYKGKKTSCRWLGGRGS